MFGVKYEEAEGSKFKEGQEGIAYLPEDNPRTFSLLRDWVYSGFLGPIDTASGETWRRELGYRLDLYCFAEKICLNNLMDCAMTTIMMGFQKTHTMLRPVVIDMIYRHTSPRSPLRKFLALCLVWEIFVAEDDCSSSELSEALGENEDLRMDVIRLLKSGERGDRDPRGPDPCEFHMHDEKGKSSCLYRQIR